MLHQRNVLPSPLHNTPANTGGKCAELSHCGDVVAELRGEPKRRTSKQASVLHLGAYRPQCNTSHMSSAASSK
ncbi:hypothetical protein TGRUB_204505 [Toxoplasma gondii RUB]|uniref:Uncharacterized protein n=1 Tax=Toxoplasma gondii RUB TaxID=935652 RepID=A0A086LYM5_TOXGO|nr:hypothetical protein TGRUB_204505 [Toxoplasma gondii RUB]